MDAEAMAARSFAIIVSPGESRVPCSAAVLRTKNAVVVMSIQPPYALPILCARRCQWSWMKWWLWRGLCRPSPENARN